MVPKYSYIKAKGGMGNRMLCTVSGILWSKSVGRQYYIDWRDPTYSLGIENSFFHFFEPCTALLIPPSDASHEVYPTLWKGNLSKSVSRMFSTFDTKAHNSMSAFKGYSVKPTSKLYQQDNVVFWHYMDMFRIAKKAIAHAFPEYGRLTYMETVGKAVVEELPLRPEITHAIHSFVSKQFQGKTVGVHIRHTDRKVPIKKIEQALNKLLNQDPSYRVFLATDSRSVEAYFKKKYNNVVMSNKWLPSTGSAHQNIRCENKTHNGIEALIDMYLLAACDELIYARRSTFSVISASIRAHNGKGSIDIDRFNLRMFLKDLSRYINDIFWFDLNPVRCFYR